MEIGFARPVGIFKLIDSPSCYNQSMDNIEFTAQENALHDFLVNSIRTDKTDLALSLIDSGGMVQPSKEVFLSSLRTLAEEGQDPANLHSAHPYTPYPYGPIKHDNITEAQRFYHEMIKRLGVSVEDLSSTHPTTTSFLLKRSRQGSLIEALANSSEGQVRKWLSCVMPGSSTSYRGDNKSSVVGLLIFTRATHVIDMVANLVPDWGQILDHRKRNALFYCQSIEDVDTALSGKADHNQLDKNSRDISTWWSVALPSSKSSDLISYLSEYGAKGVPTVEDAMVNKLMRLGIEHFDDQERLAFETASQDSSWTWEGSLDGVRRKWNLEEIWRFGELTAISARAKPLDEKLISSFKYNKTPRILKNALPDFLDTARAQIPQDLYAQWYLRIPDPKETPFIAALDFMSTIIPKGAKPPPAMTSYVSSERYSTDQVEKMYQIAVRNRLSGMDKQSQEKLIEGLDVIRDCRWAWDSLIFSPLLSQIAARTPREELYIDRELWGQYYLKLPQKASLHSSNFNCYMLSLLSTPLELESKVDNPLTAQVHIKALGLIAPEKSSRPGYPRNNDSASKILRDLVEKGALEGVSVSSRWLKHLDQETRSVVGRAMLMNKARDTSVAPSQEQNFSTPPAQSPKM